MRVSDIVGKNALSSAVVVAGHNGLNRELTWVHVVELPEPWQWIGRDQLLLTTGFSWNKDQENYRQLIRDLNHRGVAAVALAVPSYLQHFPPVAKSEANRVGLPLIEIPWEIPFSRISEQINRAIFHEQQQDRERASNIHRSLTRSAIEAESLDEIVQALASLTDQAVVLEDADGLLLAANAPGTNTLPGDVHQSTGSVRDLLSRSDWQRIRSSHVASLELPQSPDRDRQIVVCPVWIKDEFVGVIWIPVPFGSSGYLAMQAAEHAATVIALHISRERNVTTVEQRLRFTLIDSLLEGQFAADAIGLERAMLMGLNPQGAYQVAIARLSNSQPLSREEYLRREQLIERVSRRMKKQNVQALISAALNEVHIVLPAAVDAPELMQHFIAPDVTICLGRPLEGIDGIHQSYLEAKSLLTWARPDAVNTVDSLVLPRLLQGDLEAREIFIERWSAPFRETLHGNVYLQTLQALTTVGFNQRAAADLMCVHPKTMQYRVTRLCEILDIDINHTDTRFQLQLLFQLLDVA